ncbi:hypothetical protein DJ568_11320 [Mucilaginibacter hurinus]|uniref:Uncharacterized protein n=1 Tax=Mucilaginibacter hurinus TaxID=2201324 RepID=A0A367GP23_9SPHI|nr:hypothetical protein [Mucilaginibacter hurinus]RCH54411.1 hypothetical protein DJ568_11320 [Mucilaginibacter hurinus]
MDKLPVKSFLGIFDELYTGQHGDESWVIDRGGYGFLDAINSLTAEEASTAMHKGGSTIAGHSEHLRWSLAYARTYISGGQPDTDGQKAGL